MTFVRHGRLWLIVAMGIVLLALLVIIVLPTPKYGAAQPNSTSAQLTISPLFDDPRFLTPIDTPNNRPIDGTIPVVSVREVAIKIEADFNATQGVETCTVYPNNPDSVRANCTVEMGYNRTEMAEVLRLLAFRHHEQAEFRILLNDEQTSTTYVWDSMLGHWGYHPERHPSYEDPRLWLIIAYNPTPSLELTPTTPSPTLDPRPHIERIQVNFDDTPNIEHCDIVLNTDGENQTSLWAFKLVEANCSVKDGFNTFEMAELLRRLANRVFIDGNMVVCEDMGGCNAQLNQIDMLLTLEDSVGSTHYEWDREDAYWIIVGEEE